LIVRQAIAAVALALLSCGCLSGGWRRENRLSPVPSEAVGALVAEHSTLAHCLESLGAPLYVWEYQRDGLAIAYGSYHSNEFGVSVSLPVGRDASASFDYEDERAHLRGYVLLFDAEWRLIEVHEGELRDLEQHHARPRPSVPDAD
jgi:hypothetical protein